MEVSTKYATPISRTDQLRIDWEKDETLEPFEMWVIHRLQDTEDRLAKVRSRVLLACEPFSRNSGNMIVAADRVYDALEYTLAARSVEHKG